MSQNNFDIEQNQIQIYQRLTRVETEMLDIKSNIKSIKDNHLIKIYEKLDNFQKMIADLEKKILKEISSRPSWTITMIITLLSSLVTGLTIFLVTS